MSYNEYLSKKVKAMSAEQISWQLFKLTGQINYFMLFSALRGRERELQWINSNTKSREL